MTHFTRKTFLAALGALTLAIGAPSHAADQKLVLTGASTVAPLAAEIGKRFEGLHPGVKVDVQSGGSSRGVNDARQGLAHIGLVSRDLNPDEGDLTAWRLALDGVGLIVNKSNPVQNLNRDQVIAIYTGQIRNWKDVGGPDLPITVVNKAEGRSTLELFLHFYKLQNSQVKAHVIAGENEQDIKTVSANRGAIGYVSIGTAEFEVSQGVPIKLVANQGMPATVENVRNGRYPLMRTLNLVTKGTPSPLAKQFIEFAQSSGVQDLVKEQYFVSANTSR